MSKRSVMLSCMLMLAAAATSQAAPNSSRMPEAEVADSHRAGDAAANSNVRTIQQQIATAERAAAPGSDANNAERSDAAETARRGEADKSAAALSDNASRRFALVMVRPEIKSIADLTNKSIAIDDRQSTSDADVRAAIMAAGAPEFQLSKGQAKAIDRLISGEVPAAVLTLVYPEAAEWFPEIAGFRIFRIPLPPHSLQARLAPADSVAADAKPDANSVTTPSIDAAAANSNPRTIQRQVAAATALAEHVTAATAPAGRSEAIRPGDAEKTAPASSSNTDHLVALLMARPHIKSVSALSGKDIAIDDGRSASSGSVRTAIAAAGAVAAQLSEGQTKAVDRLLSGEVSAAVLTLASAEAAEWFPDIAGFKIFRVPLSPRSLQARLEPAGNADAKSDARLVAAPSPEAGAAANSNTRAIQRQVTAATVVAEHVMALRDAEKAASASQGNKDLVALVMARPDIKSISDLAGKDVAIDDRHSASSGKVKTAIAAAGAAVELSEGQTKALDRLLGGEVPAAILTLVYPETGFADIAGFRIFRVPLSPRALQPRLETAGNAAAKSDAKPETRPVTAPAKIAAPAINPSARTIRQQVAAATALAEHVTASMAPLQKADNAGVSGRTGAAQPDEPESTASVPPDSTERLIALLMARAEITSVSDLTGKEVAIGDEQSAYSRSVRNAIAAAGAPEVRLSGANATAIDRLIGGEVPAAVLTLVSPEAAEWFPDIAGFRIFRVPLSPRSLKARL